MPRRFHDTVLPAAFRLRPAGTRPPYRSSEQEESARRQNSYSQFLITGPSSNDTVSDIQRLKEQRIIAGGDHFYCARKRGDDGVAVRLGNRDLPSIPFDEGTVIQRNFQQFIVSFTQPLSVGAGVNRAPTQLVIYVSHGPLLVKNLPKEEGLTRNSFAYSGAIASTTPKELWADAFDFSPYGAEAAKLIGEGGCTVLVKNDDLSNTLYLAVTDTTVPAFSPAEPLNFWYPLEAGQTIHASLASPLKVERAGTLGFGPYVVTMMICTRVGTCSYSYWISRVPASEATFPAGG